MVSQQLLNIIIKAQDQASSTAKKVDDSLKQIGKSSSLLSKMPGFDTMKNKLTGVAQTIDGKFGGALTKARNKFSTFRNTITNAASNLRGKFGGAVDGVRSKLSGLSKSTSNLQAGFGFLKGAVSMAAGMIGYDLVSSLVETTRASLNARSSMQAFASRLKMSGEEVTAFQKSLDEMQNTYKKIDMDVVGQQATDMAFRLGLPKQSLSELTETTAIFTDAMQRNGRSAEDSMLAMSDAMDGQFVRLKEIGIGQDDLMKNGWSGDINDKTGLLTAMNKALKEQHYDELAKSVDTLDEAWQVLSITMSNLLESILVPLTPVIVGIVNGITGAVDSIKGVVGGIMEAFNGLPDFAKIGIGIGIVAGAIALIAAVLWTTYIPAWIASAAATWAAIAPVLPIVIAIGAAIGLLVAAVFEVGKAFGWWSDLGGMLDAIKSGIMRLWEAFINHPDVQAAISMISNALSTLWSWIQQAGQAVMDFFGINSSGNFDIVRALIDGVGNAWNTLKGAIMGVVGVVQWISGLFSSLWNDHLVPFGEWLNGMFAPVWTFIGDTINAIMPFVQGLVTAFDNFKSGQLDLPGLIMTVLTSLWNIYSTIFSRISSAVINWASGIVSNAVSGATRFVQGIVSRIMSLPGRFLQYLNMVKLRIMVQMLLWVTLAKARIAMFVQGIISKLTGLPGKVYSILTGVVGRIRSAIQGWINAAKEKAKGIVDGVGNVLSGTANAVGNALNGVVDAVVKPFKDAYDQAKKVWDDIRTLNGLLPQGGEGAMGGEPLIGSNASYTTGSQSVDVNHNITLDLVNVPAQIDTNTLITMLKDPTVLRAFTSNPDFQSLDAKVKERLNLKQIRARGR